MKVTILGCGASAGVPMIGCECATCASSNPKNKRSRVSILVESAKTKILIDTSPDLRQQALANGIKTVDAILYTHAHADHIHGIDDTRSFNFHRGEAIAAYGDAETMEYLQSSFSYVFRPPIAEYGWFRPCMDAHIIEPNKPFVIGDIDIIPFAQEHGRVNSMGFRFGDFVYSTDVKNFPKESEQYLKNIDTWLLDCLTDEKPMPTHADLPLSLEWIAQYKPNRAVLTHLSHSLEYEKLTRETPQNVAIAYDGLVLEL